MEPIDAEIEAELSLFNCLAYDLLRKESIKAKTIPPCWLCLSDQAKVEARTKFTVWFSQMIGRFGPPMSVVEVAEDVDRRIGGASHILAMVGQWRAVELEFKRRRDAGDARAFLLIDYSPDYLIVG